MHPHSGWRFPNLVSRRDSLHHINISKYKVGHTKRALSSSRSVLVLVICHVLLYASMLALSINAILHTVMGGVTYVSHLNWQQPIILCHVF